MIFQAYQMPHKDNKVLFGFSIHVRCLQNKPHFTFHFIGTTDDFLEISKIMIGIYNQKFAGQNLSRSCLRSNKCCYSVVTICKVILDSRSLHTKIPMRMSTVRFFNLQIKIKQLNWFAVISLILNRSHSRCTFLE